MVFAIRHCLCSLFSSHVFFQFSLALWSPRSVKRELVCMLIMHLFVYLACVSFCLFLFILASRVGCGMWLWHPWTSHLTLWNHSRFVTDVINFMVQKLSKFCFLRQDISLTSFATEQSSPYYPLYRFYAWFMHGRFSVHTNRPNKAPLSVNKESLNEFRLYTYCIIVSYRVI